MAAAFSEAVGAISSSSAADTNGICIAQLHRDFKPHPAGVLYLPDPYGGFHRRLPCCAHNSQWHTGQKLISLYTSPRFFTKILKRSTHKSPPSGSTSFASRSRNALILKGLFNSRLYNLFGSFTKTSTHYKESSTYRAHLGGRVAPEAGLRKSKLLKTNWLLR